MTDAELEAIEARAKIAMQKQIGVPVGPYQDGSYSIERGDFAPDAVALIAEVRRLRDALETIDQMKEKNKRKFAHSDF